MNTIQRQERGAGSRRREKDADALGAYLRRHALHPPLIQEHPHPRLGLVVVIPSHDEPELIATLDDLKACRRPECAVEVIVTFNRAAGAPRELARRHEAQVAQAREWARDCAAGRPDGWPRFHMLDFPGLPKRHAGVGLARKLGMDEAVSRLAAVGNGSAPIVCLDADCRVGPEYLTALERHFALHPDTPACSLHFEHDWEKDVTGAAGARERDGIVQYELHLRCVVAGLRLAGHPHAFHTVGSAMAVRADAYARQGGMNRRKGAEDFYFLAKMMPLGGFSVLTGATVIPSARRSHRVPFGTGRAMTEWMEGGGTVASPTISPVNCPAILTNAPESYRSLGRLLGGLPGLHGSGAAGLSAFVSNQDDVMAGFLESAGFSGRVAEIRCNTASAATFDGRMMRWWDRFRVLKWMHYARDRAWPDVPAEQAALELLAWGGHPAPSGGGYSTPGFSRRAALLERFRDLERRGRE